MATILLVDDAKFMRILLRNMLEKGGHTIVGEAADGIEAFDKYKSIRPDVVTLDITMPLRDGIEALKDIIAFDKDANVIMCSAMGQQGFVIDAVKNGAKDFLVKPFQEDKVLSSIAKIL